MGTAAPRAAAGLLLLTLALIPPSTALGQPADRPPKGADAATGSGPPAGAAVETGAKPPPFVLVEGQITDLTGGGQEGASVIVRRQREDGKPGEVLGRGTTDKLGDFRVTSKKRIRGDIVVTVSMPKFSDLTRTFHLSDDDEFPPYLAEALEGKVVVIGRVVDAQNDQPVEKAAVKLTAADRDWSATTDEDGRFVIKGVVPGRGVLIVEAAGSGKERQRVGRLENFGEILVRLKPQRVVRVEVVDESQRPVAGATVEFYDEPRDDFRTRVTDKKGLATFRGVHFDAAMIEVRLTHDAHVSSDGFDRQIITPEDKTTSTHRLVMRRAGRIEGTITHADTGAAVYGARVVTGGEPSHSSPRDWSDFDGRYTIVGVPPGDTVVTIHMSGMAPALEEVAVKAGETTRLDVRLSPGAVVRGMVRNKKGEALPNVLVEAIDWRGRNTLGLRAMSDREGRFVIGSAPHDEFQIIVGDARMGFKTLTVKPGEGKPIEITLADAPSGEAAFVGRTIKVGQTAPKVQLVTLAGERLNLSQWKGKTVLLDFWATWCGPCVAELPYLEAVHKKFGPRKDFVMVSVSLDDDEASLRDFVKRRKMGWHQVQGEQGGAQVTADNYGVVGIPALFLIDRDGKVAGVDLSAETVGRRIDGLLKPAP